MRRTITYSGLTNVYSNAGPVRSHGAELELRWSGESVGAFLNGSWTRPRAGSAPEFVTPDGGRFLGQPALKLALGAFWRYGRFTIAPSAIRLSARPAQTAASAQSGVLDTADEPAIWTADLNLTASQLPGDFDLSLSAHNLGAAGYRLVQPYAGEHAPLPSLDREILLNVVKRW